MLSSSWSLYTFFPLLLILLMWKIRSEGILFFLKLQYLFILVKFSGSEDPWQFNNIGWLFWYTVLGSKRLKPEHPRLRETSLNSKIKF